MYEEAMTVAGKLKEARQEVVRLTGELKEAKYDLAVAKAKVERALIKKVGGEKKLGLTAEDRERVYTLALDADETYRSEWKRHFELETRLDLARAKVSALQDQLNVILTAMAADAGGSA